MLCLKLLNVMSLNYSQPIFGLFIKSLYDLDLTWIMIRK
jgi:hypothetical protein